MGTSLTDKFNVNSTPPHHFAYSAKIFSLLTFSLVSDLSYPFIAPSDSVVTFVFEDSIPVDGLGTVIMLNKVIPHIDDIQEIIGELLSLYIDGKRSVTVQLLVSGRLYVLTFHFSKVGHFAKFMWLN